MLGSSNGALVHICGALGIPMLPQTVLVPVRRGKIDPDDPEDDIARSMEPARAMLARNQDVVLHHMHDPNQDRLMVQRMTYFRVKRTRLGPVYENFLHERLEPGATIYLAECGLSWPTTSVQDRHVFQFGALGGATTDEFMLGGDRVAEYLSRHGADRERWVPLADFFREWHKKRGIGANRLLVESFVLMDPYLAMQTGSVPYWMVFNKEPSADNLERFLAEREAFDEINLMLFSHGVDSIGLPPIERWEAVLKKARNRGRLSGVDPEAYPRDFAVFVRYRDPLVREVEERYPVPPPLPLEHFEAFLRQRGEESGVTLAESGLRSEPQDDPI